MLELILYIPQFLFSGKYEKRMLELKMYAVLEVIYIFIYFHLENS